LLTVSAEYHIKPEAYDTRQFRQTFISAIYVSDYGVRYSGVRKQKMLSVQMPAMQKQQKYP